MPQDDPVISRHLVGGIVNNHKSLSECKKEREMRKNFSKIEQLRHDMYYLEVDLKQKLEVLSREKAKLSTLSTDDKTFELQLERVKLAENEVNTTEQEHDKVQMHLHKVDVEAAELKKHFEEKDAVMSKVAEKRSKNERKAARQFLRVRRDQVEELHAKEQELFSTVEPKIEAARIEREKAKKRVVAKKEGKKKLLKKVQENYKVHHQKRAESILKLKASTRKIQAELQSNNNRRAQREAKLAAREREEFDKILEAGGNPYEVFRRRKQEAKIRATKASIEKKLKQSEMTVAQSMIDFDDYVRQKDAQAKKAKDYEEQYSKSLGRHVQEERVRKYMQSRTIGGVDSIDPTGRLFRVQPSQVTVTKSHAFGLGNVHESRGDIVDKIASQHPGIKPNLKLISPRLRQHVPKSVSSAPTSPTNVKRRINRKQHQSMEEDLVNQVRTEEELNETPPPGVQYLETDQAEPSQCVEDERQLVAALPSDDLKSVHTRSAICSSSDKSNRKFKLREQSKLEKQMLTKARETQLKNIVKDQVVWGRAYKGSAFLAKPSILHFKDFQVGKVYSKTFTLTNVSYTFNGFKLLPLPEEVKNFFTITYEKPGRMSAGMTCKVKIVFEPQVNEDISVNLPFLANTGEFAVPIRCTIRTVKPELSSETVNFGTVVIGEQRKQVIKITNDGALDCAYSITPTFHSGGNNQLVREEDISVADASGEIQGYSSKMIQVVYAPIRESLSKMDCSLEISFSNKEYICKPLSCHLTGSSSDVPIYTDFPEMDFQCCAFDKLYRSELVMRNRGHTAFRVQVQAPKGLDEMIEILPRMGFVQGRDNTSGEDGKFQFQIKFRPKPELLDWCQTNGHVINVERSEISIPLNITVTGQVLPVLFSLKAMLTSSDIEFSPEVIDFGECYTNESVSVPIKMRNLSMLQQKFAFVKLKPAVDVQPASGFGTLLPFESRPRDVIFSPSVATMYDFSLLCRSSLNRTFVIPCRGRGVDPPLILSSTTVKFGATGLGTRSAESVFITNPSSRDSRVFHFQLPQDNGKYGHHGITVSPIVATVGPNQTVRLEVEFAAQKYARKILVPESEEKVQADEGRDNDIQERDQECKNESEMDDTVSKMGAEKKPTVTEVQIPESVGKVEYSEPGEPWSKHCEWMIPCFVQGFDLPVVLSVTTVTIEADIISDQDVIDFDQVSVGHPKVMVLRLRNNGNQAAKLFCEGLNPVGPFSIVNAIRPIPPQESIALTIKFTPQANVKYRETLTLVGNVCKLDISLAGHGVSPVLEVEIEDEAEPNVVNFGNVYSGEMCKKTFKLCNRSVFGLDYSIDNVEGSLLPTNFGGKDVFAISPQIGSIDAQETCMVEVEFAPDQELLAGHIGKFQVKVPNQVEEKVLMFKGSCWDTPLFAYLEHGSIAVRDQVVDEFSFQAKEDNEYTVEGVFDEDGNSSSVKLLIGSCSATKAGNYELIDVPDTLQVDKPKGAVKSNALETVKIALVEDHPNRFGEHRILCKLDCGGGVVRQVNVILRKRVQ